MPRKAKKNIHPMPKLGWQDQLLYWFAMVMTGGFCVMGVVLVNMKQKSLAFSDPDVIARTIGPGDSLYIWMLIWSMGIFLLLLLGPYQKRYPIFGRKDIPYGPPAYPRIYPVFMKNKPQHWKSPAELRKKKKLRILVAIVLVVSFMLCLALLGLSLCGRVVLHSDGALVMYHQLNREVKRFSPEEIVQVELGTYSSGGRLAGRWHIQLTVTTVDSSEYHFAAHCFAGTKTQQLQTMIYVKEQLFAYNVEISGTENLQKVIRDQYAQTDQIALLYQLFEITP